MRRISQRFLSTVARHGVLAAMFLLSLTTSVLAAPTAPVLAVERDNWYAIRFQNALIGYSRYSIEESVELGSDRFYVINSVSRVKLGPEAINEVVFASRLLLNRASLLPSLFVCSQRQGALDLRTECLFTPRLVAQKNAQGNQEITHTVNVETPPFLLCNNIWGRIDSMVEHYAVLLAAWRARGEGSTISVYDPVLRSSQPLSFKSEGRSTVSVPGRSDMPARVVLVSDSRGPLARAWVSDGGRLLRLDDIHGGFVFTLSDVRVEALLKKSVGVDLNRDRLGFSNIWFPDSAALRSFRATVDLKVSGQPSLTRSAGGYSQTFEGTLTDGAVKGTVTVETRTVTVKASTPFPRRAAYEGALASFTRAEPGVEAADEEVHSKGEEVAWRSRTAWEAATRVNTWIHDKVADGFSMPSGRYVLQTMSGNSESKALLAVTLLRSINIPARRVSGVAFQKGYFAPHSWVEVYVGDEGWVPIDPSTGEAGTLGATHVALGEACEASRIEVAVSSYSPTPPRRVPFFTRELTWPVGQRRVYTVVHGGKEIGTEIAQVNGLTKLDGHDVYDVSFSMVRTLDGKRSTAKSRLLVTPDVLPRRCSVDGSDDGVRWERAFDFTADAATERMQVGTETKVQTTPLSEGVYVLDPHFYAMYALVVGQLPNPGRGTKATMHVYDPQTHATREITLQIRQEEKVGVGGEEKDTWRCETPDGLSFFMEKSSGQVVRIEAPRQDIVLQLVESATRL